MRPVVIVSLIVAAVSAGDFLDDFESYAVGEDPADSPDWSREPSGGYVLVADDSGDKVTESYFPDSTFTGYLCEGAGFWDDGSVSMDFNVTGSGALVNVLARMQLMTGDAYAGGVIVWLQPFTFAYIARISITGEYEILFQGGGPSMTPDTWVDVELEVTGNDPVTLTLYCNDQLTGQVQDSLYLLGSGLSGFAYVYEDQAPTIRSDDFQVVLIPQSLEEMTFGGIKATFGP